MQPVGTVLYYLMIKYLPEDGRMDLGLSSLKLFLRLRDLPKADGEWGFSTGSDEEHSDGAG